MKYMRWGFSSALAAVALVAGTFAHTASAASTVIVTSSNTQGWSTAATNADGSVSFVLDATSPAPSGALKLTTNSTPTAKAQYLHAANTPLADVTELSYATKRISGPSFAAASFQLLVHLGGPGLGFTTLVFEPYQNGSVAPSAWQQWDVDAGQFWSSRSFSSGSCVVAAGGGGAPFYSLATLKANCPNAVAIGFGVNLGSNNPDWQVETDLVSFNETAYNFQYTNFAPNKDACKNGGFANFTDSNGNVFKNQGQCVSWSNHNN